MSVYAATVVLCVFVSAAYVMFGIWLSFLYSEYSSPHISDVIIFGAFWPCIFVLFAVAKMMYYIRALYYRLQGYDI